MSIKGIDSQIMLSRLPDNVKEASSIQKKPELMQEFLATQGKLNDAQDQTRVAKTSEAEMENIRTDVDGGSGNDGGEENEKSGEKNEMDEVDPDMLVPPGHNVIDITI